MRDPMSAIKLAQAAVRFADLPGQACLMYFDKDTDTVISICPTPRPTAPNILSYNFSAQRVGSPFDWEDAAEYVELAVSKFELTPNAAQPPKVAMTTVATTHTRGGICHSGQLCLEVSK